MTAGYARLRLRTQGYGQAERRAIADIARRIKGLRQGRFIVSGPHKTEGAPRRRTFAGWRSLINFAPGLALTALILVLHALQPSVVSEARNLLFDEYQRLAPRPYQPTPVKVVDIDDESLAKLGQWPWPRTDVARLATAIAKSGAASITFDIVFSEPDRTSPARIADILRKEPNAKSNYNDVASLPDHDQILGQALAATPSVTAFVLTNDKNNVRPRQKAGIAISGTAALDAIPDFRGAIAPLSVLDNGPGSGFISVGSDHESLANNRDGILREVPLLSRIGDAIYPSLFLDALRVAQGASTILLKTTTGSGEFGGASQPGIVEVKVGTFDAPTTRPGGLWMYYRQPRDSERIPAWKVLTGALSDAQAKSLFDGQIVFIGASAEGLRDLVSTPVADRELGVDVHAQAVEQIILGKFLTRPDWADGLERVLLLIFGIGLALALPSLGALRGGVLAAIALAGSGAGSWYSFRSAGLILDPTYPAFEVVAVYVASTLYSFYREERARAYIHNAFDRYLSPEMVQRIAADPSQLELGGEERDMSVMFCDIRGFSRISESLSPRQVIAFLKDFLTPTSDILLAHKATIDKFIGDAILAFWNAPLDDADHPRNAATASLAMAAKIKELNAVNPHLSGKTWPGEVRIGIGLNSGPCYVGNIGSDRRLNYSLIGDTVNLTSRIEGLTKYYGVTIAMGHDIAARLTDFAAIELDVVRVVGRDTPEHVYALLGAPEMKSNQAYIDLADKQTAFLAAYRAKAWDSADTALAQVSAHAEQFGLAKLFKLYADRIVAFRHAPPPDDWDGVFEAQTK
jgi:adenylate cyclase